MADDQDIKSSYLRIRKTIGILGILLPGILLFTNNELLPSLSHYYYTPGALFFIAILAAFGLFLISYKGYNIDLENEKDWLSDDVITIIGGICVLIVVLIPTSCEAPIAGNVDLDCLAGSFQLYGHNSKMWGTIHLVSAAVFLATMGYLSFNRFSRSKNLAFKKFYKVCGVIVWLCVLLLIARFLVGKKITDYDVFILETVAVVAFGASWLIKGKILETVGLVKENDTK